MRRVNFSKLFYFTYYFHILINNASHAISHIVFTRNFNTFSMTLHVLHLFYSLWSRICLFMNIIDLCACLYFSQSLLSILSFNLLFYLILVFLTSLVHTSHLIFIIKINMHFNKYHIIFLAINLIIIAYYLFLTANPLINF